jgi:hypothetical protein
MIEVTVNYEASLWPQMDEVIKQAVGRSSNFSGMGCGLRDHGWNCESEIDAHRVARSLRKIGLSPSLKERLAA